MAFLQKLKKSLGNVYLVSGLFCISGLSWAEHNDVAPVGSEAVEYFKYRDNRGVFKEIKAGIDNQLNETRELLPALEQSVSDKPQSSVELGNVDSRLDNVVSSIKKTREILQKSKQNKADRSRYALSAAIDERMVGLQQRLLTFKSAKNKAEKKLAVQSLRAEIERYDSFKQQVPASPKPAGEPNGLTVDVPKLPEGFLKAPDDKKPGNAPVKSQKEENFSTSLNNQSVPSSLMSTGQRLASTLFNFIIPRAEAAEYQLPAVNSGTAACYPSNYPTTLTNDLGLSQPELEIDNTLDAEAYRRITQLAAQLNYSPVKIFEYVTNNIEYEHYYGSVKGALGTLQSKKGNDIDHASLLIALLRASSIPAHYINTNIALQNKQTHLDWLQVKTLDAAAAAAGAAKLPWSRLTDDVYENTSAFSMRHVYVEACIPYGDYRGDGRGTEGHRWIALDAGFKKYERIDGISHSETLNYANFLLKRTKKLPFEEFESQLSQYLRTQDANYTLNDVGTRWVQKKTKIDFLPDSLPYSVLSASTWDGVVARSATVPPKFRATVKVVWSGISFDIPMTDFVQHRITLAFEGNSSTDIQTYNAFMNGDGVLSCPANNLTLKPVFRKDGVVINPVSSTGAAVNLGTFTLCNSNQYRALKLSLGVQVNGTTLTAISPSQTGLVFNNISALNYYALSVYGFNGSDEFLQARNHRLLGALAASQPDRDESVGEFLNITALKYMRYVTDANKKIGRLYGSTGSSGFHIGVAATRADIEYIYDLPYAVQSNNFFIDVPGALSTSSDINTGGVNVDALRLSAYTLSHYESYIWQENALKDAVSTVSGLQIAAENNNPVQSFSTGAELDAFVSKCTAEPNPNTWPNNKPLAEMVAAYRAAGARTAALREFFIANNTRYTSYSTETEIDNALAVPYSLCYSPSWVSTLIAGNFPADTTSKVTIPKRPISFNGWEGPVYATEHFTSTGSYSFGFPISAFSGGYTVPTSSPSKFNTSTSNPNYSTGYKTNPLLSSNNSPLSILSVNSGINDGFTQFNTLAGDPVNMVTGNMYHEETDLAIPARGLPLLFKRTYNSNATTNGPLGWGWTHSFNQKLKFMDAKSSGKADTIVWTDGSGSQKYIGLLSSITQTNGILNITADKVDIPDGFYFTVLRPYSSGTPTKIEIKEKDGMIYRFEAISGAVNSEAKLTEIIDANGNTISLIYANGRLHQVKDPDNRTMTFAYNTANKISTITLDWANITHNYFYQNDHLTAYRNPVDHNKNIDTSSYSYYSTADGVKLDHKLKSFGYANGYKMTFEYYANGKTYRHYNAEGESMTFAYNDYRREAISTDELGRVQKYIFNEDGLPVEITSPSGGKELYEYADTSDPMLRTSSTDVMGYKTLYGYSNGNVTSQTLPSNHTINYYDYTTLGKPQLIKNARGDYTLTKFDVKGNPTDAIVFKSGFGASINVATFDPEANSSNILSWTRMTYNANGKLIKSQQVKNFADKSTGPYVEYGYTDSGNSTEGVVPTSVTYSGDVNGNGSISAGEGLGTYANQYDALGRLVKGFDGARYPVAFRFDNAGKLLESTDGMSRKTTYSYDASGLVIGQNLLAKQNGQIVLADNNMSSYDKANRRVASADSSGAISNYEYDAAGNVKKITSPDGYAVYFDYDADNRVTKTYDAEGNAVERKLDLIGRVKQLINASGSITQYSYYGPEQNGRLKRVTDAENRWTEFTYDALGQVTRVIDNASRETLSNYDAMGRVVRTVGPVYGDIQLGQVRPVTTYKYNSLGHQTEVWAGYTSSQGDQVSQDQLTIQATYTYDDFGRLLKKTDAANNEWSVTEYDIHGNVKSRRDPLGRVTTATYYAGGLLESLSTTGNNAQSTGALNVGYQYNGIGQPKSITSANVTYSYEYDSAHRLSKVTDSRGNKSVVYDYSVGGLLNSISDSDGNKASYLYDAARRLTGVRTPDNKLISYVYDSTGRLQQKVFPNDLITAYQYFNDNKVKSITTTNASGAQLLQQAYTYNTTGNTETASYTISGATQMRSYSYDGLGRLTTERDTTNNVDLDSISYDPYGNRRQRTQGGVTHHYTHNNLLQISEIRSGSATGPLVANFGYDANGNMTLKTFAGTTTDITYDAFDRAVTVTKGGVATEQYGYDQGSRRISKTVGSATTNYLYSGPDILAEYNSSWSAPQAIYAHGAAMDDPLVRIAANSPSYYHGDALGSVVATSNNVATITASNRYDAWGNVTASSGTTAQYGYTGREPNANGLIYSRARFYDPQIGRFTQQDPKGFIDGINQYAYVMNSPVNYVDPWGTFAVGPSVASGGSYGWGNAASDIFKAAGPALIPAHAMPGMQLNAALAEARGVPSQLGLSNQIASDAWASLSHGASANGLQGLADIASLAASAGRGTKKHSSMGIAGDSNFYRGAKPNEAPDFTPRPGEYKVNKTTGTVSPTHGVSVYNSPDSMSPKWIPHKVDQSSIPDTLQIKQRGVDLTHFEIMPKPNSNLTPEEFIDACRKITCTK